MLVEQQIAERRERATAAIAKVLERPGKEPYGDYRVQSASGKTYRVAMRGPGLFENYCSCPDFAVNTLGTCKHDVWAPRCKRRRFAGAGVNVQVRRSCASLRARRDGAVEARVLSPVDLAHAAGPR